MATDVTINGEMVTVEADDILSILDARGIDANKGGVAVALNGEVVPRAEWDQTAINPEDKIEIVHIVRGG